MSQIEDDQNGRTTSTTSTYVLPQRIEFHLSKKSSFSFNGSSYQPQIPSVPLSSGPLHSSVENDMNSDFKSHIIVRRIGAGLENLGNTCFLNSVLQCLTYTEPLVAYLQSGKHQYSCRVVGFCALCSVQKHVTRALQATGRVLPPKDLVSNLRCISRNFRNARQEDAHEYMVHLLESMHKCCLPSGVPSESSSAYEKSFVHKIFGGCLRSQVKCMQCSYCSNKFDPFLDLSLEIVKADSLQKALTHFTAQEQLDSGERRYQCQQCKQKVRALKQLTIDKAPHVLTIHLKRFGSHISGQKIDKKVQFGPTLNLKPFVSGSYDGDLKYTLYGVLVHAGWSTHSGHYYCFIRTSSGMWYSLDDSRVAQVSERAVMEQKAYMLFYLRDEKTWTPENIGNAIPKHKIVPTATQNGSCSISAASPRLENRSTAKPASAVLDKAIPTALENGTGSTAATCDRSQDRSADKSVNSVPKGKTMTSVVQNGSCDTNTVSQGFPKGSGEKYLEGRLQSNMDANKFIGVDASDDIVRNNIPNGHLANQSLSKEGSDSKCKRNDLPQSPFEGSNVQLLACSKRRNGGNLSTINDEAAILHSSKRLISVDKNSKINLVSVVKPSEGPTDVAEKTVTWSSDKAGCALEEPVPEKKPKIKSSLSKSNCGIVRSIGLTSNAFSSSSHQKLKRKGLAYRVVSTHLSMRMLCEVSLKLQKRKNHKKVKRHQQFVATNIVNEQMGPSTSHVTSAITAHISSSPKKGSKCGVGKRGVGDATSDVTITGISIAESCASELKKRIASGNTMPVGDDRSLKSPKMPVTLKHQQERQHSHFNGKINVDNGIAVARWDDIELESSQTVDAHNTNVVSIGYVPDEWDEEYDRGRRKKVRTPKISFGGPNPFQEIATMVAKSNDRSKRYNLANPQA